MWPFMPRADQIFDLSDVDESRAYPGKGHLFPPAQKTFQIISLKGRLNDSRPIVVNDSSDSDSDDNPIFRIECFAMYNK